jgi:RimJ/RimL family protein N-acetyltransferase
MALDSARTPTLRPAKIGELRAVRRMIEDAIIESIYYSQEMKDYELRRFDLIYLHALFNVDPNFILIVQNLKGECAGFMLSGPEHGILVNYWAFIAKPYRIGSLAVRSTQSYVQFWNNQSFYKIVTFTRVDNILPQKILRKCGYIDVATLKEHYFGEDYIQFEYQLQKAIPGHILGVSVGWFGKLKARMLFMFF